MLGPVTRMGVQLGPARADGFGNDDETPEVAETVFYVVYQPSGPLIALSNRRKQAVELLSRHCTLRPRAR